jgi:uncharacterized membrane protein YfcA
MVLGFEFVDFLIIVIVALAICVTVCTLAMEAAVLFTPAFIFVFPYFIEGFPKVTANEAIGLAITIEFFGYTSSVLGYWFRRQVDLQVALKVLAYTVPLAVFGRMAAYFIPEVWLLMLFGLVLLALAAIIFREYQGEMRHTCLLCGDSLMAMKYGGDADAAGPGEAAPAATGFIARAQLGHAVGLVFNAADRVIMWIAGAFAGLVGVAIGEISNTFLTVRKDLPVKIATGTSALVLHLTILSALAANLLVLWADLDVFEAKDIDLPWRIVIIIAPVVIIGGQIGAYINSKVSDRALIRAMITAYSVIGVFVLTQIMA